MATSKDVAKLAGVSIATVSRTFTKRNTVSERTAQRVLDAAKKLDYTPDNIARSLKSNKTNTIGFVISNIYNPFFFQAASVMAKELEKYNYKILLSFNKEYDETLSNNIQSLLSAKVDAIAFTPIIYDKNLSKILHSRNINLLQLLGNKYSEFDSILFDDYRTTCNITQYLIDHGHKKIMMIAATEDRKHGMLDTLNKNDISTYAGNYVSVLHVNNLETIIEHALLKYQPTAVISVSLTVSEAFLRVVKRLKLQIPDDISVIGYDDNLLLELCDISAVGHDIENLGKKACNLLLNRINHSVSNNIISPQHPLLDTHFIERNSVKYI